MIVNNCKPITLEEAREKIHLFNFEIKTEKLYFNDSLGRILSKDIVSEENIPSFDKSPLDGYAFIKEDVISASLEKPVRLDVIDLIMAGDVSEKEIQSGQAVRIMTGAKIPKGANCVVRYEDTKFGDDYVEIFSPIGKNLNIIKTGEDILKGEIIIPKGTVIHPAEIGVLASLGIEYIEVVKKPKITVFSTGSELVDVGDKLEDGKIRNSNSYTIEQLAKTFGAEVNRIGIVDDNLNNLMEVYKTAIEESDIVISTGGISVGDGDFVLTAMNELEVCKIFSRVSVRPGGHVFAGVKNEKFIFGLSGNPAASFINFHLYVRPIILKMQGLDYFPKVIKSTLINDYKKTAGVMRVVRAKTYIKDFKFYSEITDKQNSGVLSSMVDKNTVVIIPKDEVLTKNSEILVEFIYE